MSFKSQIVFVSSSRDMAEWAALTSAHVRDFGRRHGLPNLEALDYRDIDPANLDHATTWQDGVGSPSRAEVALTVVLFGERVGTPLPASFGLKEDIYSRLVRAGYDWVHVTGMSPHPLQPEEVPLTGVLFEFFDVFLPSEDGVPSAPLRVIFKGTADVLGEPDFGNGDFRAKIESAPIAPQEKRQLRKEYVQQLDWMTTFWRRVYGLQQHASLFCPDQRALLEDLERVFAGVFTAGNGVAPGSTQHFTEAVHVELPGPGSYDLERAKFFLGRGPQIAELSQRALMLDAPRQFVVVTGESGTGKSSLLRAGLMNSAHSPSQRRLGWRSAFLSLSERGQSQTPIQFLAASLTNPAALPELGSAESLCQRLEAAPEEEARRFLKIIAETKFETPLGYGLPKLLIVVDQGELALDGARVEGSGSAHDWKTFLQVLGALGDALINRGAFQSLDNQAQQVSARLRCSVVMGLPADRFDFLGEILQAADRVFPVPRMVDETAIREIISGTFTALGLKIDGKAREALCREAVNLAVGTDASILPLLSVTLSSLHESWKRRLQGEQRRRGRERKKQKASATWSVNEENEDGPRADIELDHVRADGRLDQSIEKLGELAWNEVSQGNVPANMRSLLQDLPISAPRNKAKSGEITGAEFALAWLLRRLVVVSPDDKAPDRLVGLPDEALEPVARPLAEAMRNHRLLTRHDDGTWWLVNQSVLKSWRRASEWREAESQIHRTTFAMELDLRRWREAAASGSANASRWLWTQEQDVEQALEWLTLCGREDNPELFDFAKMGMNAAVAQDGTRAGRIIRASCYFNDLEWAQELLQLSGGSCKEAVNSLNKQGSSSALYLACLNGNAALVRLLLEAGALPNLKLSSGWTPLGAAATVGTCEVCDALLGAGAIVNHATEAGWTPLAAAAENGYVEVVDRLLSAGADVNHLSNTGASPLFLAALNGHDGAVDRLLGAGAQPDGRDNDGLTPLAAASENGHPNIVNILIAAGADVNCTSRDGSSALLRAAKGGHDRVVDCLLDAGAEVNHIAKGAPEDPPADVEESLLCRETLLSDEFSPTLGSGLEAITSSGTTALFWAAFRGHDRIVDRLLTAGAEVNHVTDGGWTPLTVAAQEGHQTVVHCLLSKGANVHHMAKHGSTALTLATRNGHEAVVRVLLDRGAEVNHRPERGQTPLMDAAIDRDEKMAALLLHYGADVLLRDQGGRCAMDFACIQDSEPIIQMLLDAGASSPPDDEIEKLRGEHISRNIGLVVNARGKMCLVHDTPFNGVPLWVGYHMDLRQIEIIFDAGTSYRIDWVATDEMDGYLQRINKILIIRMVSKKPVEGYDTSLLHLKDGKAIELE